jgi:uroporphyrinogen-III synthase
MRTVEVPLVAVQVIEGAVAELVRAIGDGEGVYVAATSANATEAIAQAAELLGYCPQVAVIGAATAAAARSRGLRVALEAETPSARALGQAIAREHPVTVVWSQAQHPLPDLALELQHHDIEVVEIPTYVTVAAEVSAANRAALLDCDLVTVASPSAVLALHELVGSDHVPPLVSIGPTTTAAAEDLGLVVIEQASTPSVPAMVDAVTAAGRARGQLHLDR